MIDIKLHNPVMLVKQIPEVVKATGLTETDTKKIMLYAADLMKEDYPGFPKYSVITNEQAKEAGIADKDHATGMEAICWLCREKNADIHFIDRIQLPATIYGEFPRVWMDISMLCSRIESRNKRLTKIVEMDAPEVIQRNEQRMLLEYVNDLEDTSWHKPLQWTNGRMIRCLADIDYSLLTGWSEEMLDAWAQGQLELREAAAMNEENEDDLAD